MDDHQNQFTQFDQFNQINQSKKTRKFRFKLWYILIILIILSIAGIFYANFTVKRISENYLTKIIGSRVQMDAVNINLITQKISVRQLKILNPAGYSDSGALVVKKIIIDANPWKIFSSHILVNDLYLEQVTVRYELSINGSNWNKILENINLSNSKIAEATKNSQNSHSPKTWHINKLIIENPNLIVTFNQKSIAELKLNRFEMTPLDQNDLSSDELIKKLAGILQYQLLHNKIETEIPQVIRDTGTKVKQKIEEIF